MRIKCQPISRCCGVGRSLAGPTETLRGPQPRPTKALVLPQIVLSTNDTQALHRETASAYRATRVRNLRVSKAQGAVRDTGVFTGEGKGEVHHIPIVMMLTHPSAAQKEEVSQELTEEPLLDSSAKEIACDHLM